jgi:ABC-type phosphate transport system substrate-binding protein
MSVSFRRVVVACVAVAIAAGVACAGAGSGPSNGDRPNRAVITADELPAAGTETVFDVIQRLRPEYLRQRPQGGATVLSVFASGQLVGDVAELKRIPATSIMRIQHYSIEQAKNKFGMQYSGGGIEITYR